jgi:hypothetical protein
MRNSGFLDYFSLKRVHISRRITLFPMLSRVNIAFYAGYVFLDT